MIFLFSFFVHDAVVRLSPFGPAFVRLSAIVGPGVVAPVDVVQQLLTPLQSHTWYLRQPGRLTV
ncbi:hypothetical protein QP858_09795 [Trueperella bernardiae]|uniref:Secreted protein n=1 Tax=Trueperella bernardiae TaxID=59561 RepID=A0AAW6ZLR9_9ACTO|nr:hypothetical protein [Trueperella bernardiae]MDK8602745.1 hypothetical protein [Trueperella bernardiae]